MSDSNGSVPNRNSSSKHDGQDEEEQRLSASEIERLVLKDLEERENDVLSQNLRPMSHFPLEESRKSPQPFFFTEANDSSRIAPIDFPDHAPFSPRPDFARPRSNSGVSALYSKEDERVSFSPRSQTPIAPPTEIRNSILQRNSPRTIATPFTSFMPESSLSSAFGESSSSVITGFEVRNSQPSLPTSFEMPQAPEPKSSLGQAYAFRGFSPQDIKNSLSQSVHENTYLSSTTSPSPGNPFMGSHFNSQSNSSMFSQPAAPTSSQYKLFPSYVPPLSPVQSKPPIFSEFENRASGDTLSSASSLASPPSPPPEYPIDNPVEHPMGEHPNRTLFVRNINSSTEDEELRNCFEKFGPIRSMYTQTKNRGFVMISYYDIRHAKNAMRQLQNKLIRKRNIEIHYAIPKENPTEKETNQGTLVVFGLDPLTTNEELEKIFREYGEVKEIRETVHKKHHKFVEFYDTRAAERALKALNKTEIKGKKIKIELAKKVVISASSSNRMPADLDDMYRRSSFDSRPSTPDLFYSSPSFYPNIGGESNNSASVGSFPDTVGSASSASSLPNLHSAPVATRNEYGHISPPQSSSHPNQGLISTLPSSRGAVPARARAQSTDEDKYKFALNISQVKNGTDKRTTLYIRNIPNKYNQKMLLQAIDEHFAGSYDFFYLPIDFRNKCNMGYAFINFLSPENIIPFYERWNNQKWEKFKSEKVCEIAYARIQGKQALINHFRNSPLLAEDKGLRPILLQSDGPNAGQPEPFPGPFQTRTSPNPEREIDLNSPESNDETTKEEQNGNTCL